MIPGFRVISFLVGVDVVEYCIGPLVGVWTPNAVTYVTLPLVEGVEEISLFDGDVNFEYSSGVKYL